MNFVTCAFLMVCCMAAIPACKRNESSVTDAGVPGKPDAGPFIAPVTSIAPPKAEQRVPEPGDDSIPPAEAHRKLVDKLDDEPLLMRQRDAVLGFYKENVPSPLAAQFETLPADRMAIFLSGKREHSKPYVMVIDANGTRAWTKEMPLAGIVPGVRDVAIVRGKESSVGIAFCDSTAKLAALRSWHHDGSINADFEIMDTADCAFISAAYVPRAGHLIAASGDKTAQIGMIAENGMRMWDRDGITLPWIPSKATALTIAVDTDDSFIVLGVGSKKEGTSSRPNVAILAMRYDLHGKELWQEPMNVARWSDPGPERIRARVIGTGKVEVDLEGKPRKVAELTADGIVTIAPAN